MSVQGLRLPGCPLSAWHKDYPGHVFFCDLPAGHDGKHGQEVSPGVWVHWDITMDFGATAPPPNPADLPADGNPDGWTRLSLGAYEPEER